MSNFHKPRTYRSAEGCCVCGTKSSSSRFTDSRKHENDITDCFDLKHPRQGEICNACVLLVKRYKRLPHGSKRNWNYVVDARAGIGTGYNRNQNRFKSERINSRAAVQQQSNLSSLASANTSNNSMSSRASCSTAATGLAFVPEKFSKIVKKSKKIKDNLSNNSKRKSTNNGWSQNNTHSLPTTPDSLDSDYEDTRLHGSLSGNTGGSSVVQFQTQTRASAYKAQAAAEARKKLIKLGSKRRKCTTPHKYSGSVVYEESFPFIDDEEWRKRKTCCGILYECEVLGGALLIDVDFYKLCEKHQQQQRLTYPEKIEIPNTAAVNVLNNSYNKTTLPLPKSIIQTLPAVVQLQPTPVSAPSASLSSSIHTLCSHSINSNLKTATTLTTTAKPTPALKKRHLFFKRQSECFPQGDTVATATSINNETISCPGVNNIKTVSELNQNQLHHNQQQQLQSSSTSLQKQIENAINSNTLNYPTNAISSDSLTPLSLSVSVSSSSLLKDASTSSSITTMPQMPKHSLAKVTTISPPLTTAIQNTQHTYNTNCNSNIALAKPNPFPHKVKSDSVKIGKQILAATKLKDGDVNEIKPIVRAVERSYVVAKLPVQGNNVSLNSIVPAPAPYQLLSCNGTVQTPSNTTSPSAASPTSSTSSTKFSDNSSDSGFDDNLPDHKSVSPSYEDCEKKLVNRQSVHTLVLGGPIHVQQQQQNMVPIGGRETVAKNLQNRKNNAITTSQIAKTSRAIAGANYQQPSTSVKIAQISTTSHTSATLSVTSSNVGPPISMSTAAQAKMRAIYNNSNTIQHENGITTIVPASSLAASTQLAAMQNIAPSTVTITPALPMGTQFNAQNVISRKLTTANIINLQSNTTNLSNSHNTTSGNHHHNLNSISNGNNNHNLSTTNQKIILLKTSNHTPVTASSNYNTLAGGVQQLGNGVSGR